MSDDDLNISDVQSTIKLLNNSTPEILNILKNILNYFNSDQISRINYFIKKYLNRNGDKISKTLLEHLFNLKFFELSDIVELLQAGIYNQNISINYDNLYAFRSDINNINFHDAKELAHCIELSNVNSKYLIKIPTKFELMTIVDYKKKSSPSINSDIFECLPELYWTDETSSKNVDLAWTVNFSNGELSLTPKDSLQNVRYFYKFE